jgi:tetratricopeptide (TPR) repeat protein
LTRGVLLARERRAEALEARGAFLDAVALYKQNLEDDARAPHAQPRLLGTPALAWSHFGLALKRAGRREQAAAAYEAGLRALERGRAEPDTDAWRESSRLHLLSLLITLHAGRDDAALRVGTQRMFAPQLDALAAARDEVCVDYEGSNGVTLTGVRSGRRWTLAREGAAPDDAVHAGRLLLRIKELPRAPLGPPPAASPAAVAAAAAAAAQRAMSDRERHLAAARDTLRERVPQLPSLPAARCAACGGGGAAKRCGACGGPAYCGAACQRAHWKAHKPACGKRSCAADGGAP